MSVDPALFRRQALAVLAAVFALFHFATAGFGNYPDLIQRAVHAGAAIMLAFLMHPALGERRARLALAIDLALVAGILAATIHVVVSYDRINSFTFLFSNADFAFGLLAIALVLEACRRVIGWTIPLLAMAGLAYALLGPQLPGPLAHRGVDARLVVETLYTSTRGLYGMVTGISATVIAAFVIFGAVLLRTGGGQTFMDLSLWLGGRTVGGGAKVATLSSALFGTVSGSAAANVATTGAFTIPLMKRLGYRPAFAGGVESVASTGGQLMPPIMGAGAFIMAELLGVAYTGIMVAALIPALLYFGGALAGIHFQSLRLGYKAVAAEDLPRPRDFLHPRRALPVFSALAVLIGFLVAGYSPARTAFWAIVTLVALYLAGTRGRTDLRGRLAELASAFAEAGRNLVTVAVLIVGAQILLAMIATTGAGVSFTAAIIALGEQSLWISLVLAMLVAMLLGTGLPTAAAYLLAAAVVAPALVRLGVEPISAHMFIFYFSILAGLTPPICATVFIGAAMAGAPWPATAWAALRLSAVAFLVPFVFVYHPALLMVGSPVQIAVAGLTAALGVLALASAVMGWLLTALAWWERVLLAGVAVLLIVPSYVFAALGLALLAAVGGGQALRRRAAPGPVREQV